MIAALLLLTLQQPTPHGPEPGPRAPLAGLAGFHSVSKVDFGGQQNRLTAVYVFPDRARWHFENYSAVQRSEHQFFYRQGERVRQLSSGTPSQELQGEERDGLLLQMELRRAAMLWPEGFEWQHTEAGTRSAPVSADTCCRELPLGTLVATLAGERPRRIEARDALGRVLEALEIQAWQEACGRSWPRTLALEAKGGGFVETIEAIETRVHFLELSFLPPDVRPLRETRGKGPSVMARDLVAMTYAVRVLPPPVTWEEAVAQARAWLAAAANQAKSLGLVVDPVPTFELSSEGRPLRCLVRLGAPALPAPAGYETQPERAGLFLSLQDLASLDASILTRLSSATPEGAKAGVPYIRIHTRQNLPIEVVLPLGPAD